MKRYEDPKPPTLRILGAFLGAAIPAITLLALLLVLGGFKHSRMIVWSFEALGEIWPRLIHVSMGFAAFGFLIGFDRLLNFVAPVWSAITWLWNRERALDQRVNDFLFDYFFSAIFTIVLIALVYLYVMRA